MAIVTDPVCGMRIDPDDAVATAVHDGQRLASFGMEVVHSGQGRVVGIGSVLLRRRMRLMRHFRYRYLSSDTRWTRPPLR